jgi:hypothetical protein
MVNQTIIGAGHFGQFLWSGSRRRTIALTLDRGMIFLRHRIRSLTVRTEDLACTESRKTPSFAIAASLLGEVFQHHKLGREARFLTH